MADITNLSQFLTDVAESIRIKRETTEQIPAANFDTEIMKITTGVMTQDEYDSCNNKVASLLGLTSGYKELDHIIWNDTNIGNSNIDTGYCLYQYNDWKMEFDLTFLEMMNYQHLFYSYTNGGSSAKHNEAWVYETGQFAIRFGGESGTYKRTFSEYLTANVRYKIILEYSTANQTVTVTVNDKTEVLSVYKPTQLDYTIKLGGVKTNDGTGGRVNANIYNVRFYGDGNLLMDLIPVKRESDQTNYLYDIILGRYLKPSNVVFGGVEK